MNWEYLLRLFQMGKLTVLAPMFLYLPKSPIISVSVLMLFFVRMRKILSIHQKIKDTNAKSSDDKKNIMIKVTQQNGKENYY